MRTVLTTLGVVAALLASPSWASETSVSSKYTGWTLGAGVYWTDSQGNYSAPSQSLVGHSPGVMFSVPDLPSGSFVDLQTEDKTSSLGLGPLSGQYVFFGGSVANEILGIEEPIEYGVTVNARSILSSGTFCGGLSSIAVPDGAEALQVWGTTESVCPDFNPGTEGVVSARFWSGG